MRGRGGADGRHHRDRTWPERSTCRRTCPTFGGLRIPLDLTRIRRLHGRRSGAFTAPVRSWVVVVVVGRVKARHALPILILRLRPIPIPIPHPSHIPDHAEGTRVVEPSLRLSMFPEPSPCRRVGVNELMIREQQDESPFRYSFLGWRDCEAHLRSAGMRKGHEQEIELRAVGWE